MLPQATKSSVRHGLMYAKSHRRNIPLGCHATTSLITPFSPGLLWLYSSTRALFTQNDFVGATSQVEVLGEAGVGVRVRIHVEAVDLAVVDSGSAVGDAGGCSVGVLTVTGVL